MFSSAPTFRNALVFWGLSLSVGCFAIVANAMPENVCQTPEMDQIVRVEDYDVRIVCRESLVSEKHRFFPNTRIVSSYFRFERGVLRERLVYSKDETLTARNVFEKISDIEWIVTRYFTKSPRVGQIEKKEHLIGYDPESSKVQKSFTARRWFYENDSESRLDFIAHYDSVHPTRIVKKEKFSVTGDLSSVFEFSYKGEEKNPVSFTERGVDGKVLTSYSLDAPLDVESVYRKIGLSEKQVASRVAHQKRSNRFKIAIIDSGFDHNHPALADQWWNNPLDPIDGIDNDGNGWVDDNFGWDQVNDRGLPSETSLSFTDQSRPLSHGTHVAHIATRGLRDVALIGFAGDYTRPEYIEQISRFLKTHGVRIVNMSLGLPNDFKNTMGLKDSIRAYKNMVEDNPDTLFVVASGNTLPSGVDIDVHENRQFPANLNLPNMIVVGAVDADVLTRRKYDEYVMAPYSNFGRRSVDILAAGSKVNAARLGGGLIRHSGTSMATPNVVNAVARLWTDFPELKPAEIREILNVTAYKMKGDVPVRSGGFVDLSAAIEEAKKRRRRKMDSRRTPAAEAAKTKRSSASVTDDDRTRIEYLAGRSALRGANCWNAALFANGLTVGVHFTSASEFAFVLGSPLCRKVDPSQRQTGDIVALRRVDEKGRLIREISLGEIHGYMYLSDERSFTKNGTSPKEKYEFLSTSAIEKVYVRANQLECRQMGIPREQCNFISEYFRCSSMAEFQALADNQPLPAQKSLIDKVTNLEIRLHDLHVGGVGLKASDLVEVKSKVRGEINSLRRELEIVDAEVKAYGSESNAPSRKVAEFYADLIYYRLQSLDVFMF